MKKGYEEIKVGELMEILRDERFLIWNKRDQMKHQSYHQDANKMDGKYMDALNF